MSESTGSWVLGWRSLWSSTGSSELGSHTRSCFLPHFPWCPGLAHGL